MKIKRTIAVLAGVMLATGAFAQGLMSFQNGPSTAVIDSITGTGANAGLYTAGLYYNLNLSAVPNPGVANDGWILAATAPITRNPVLGGGLYSSGSTPVAVAGVPGATEILVQIRAWSNQYGSYAAAFSSGSTATMIGASPNTYRITLARPGTTDPVLSTLGFIQGFTLNPVPEPSTVVLGLLGGLGAMLLLRRRS